ncbi:MAG: hypothetical protein PHU04_00195 [Candidatus Peribacteraceae bacterium]|nr:hypothetical protein [Candidatus Peribacteraceae bacterium]
MPNTKKPEQAKHVSTGVYRILFSFIVFSFVLTGVLTASRIFFLPSLTHVKVAGEERDIQGIRAYHTQLMAQLSDTESRRMDLILPIQNEQYRALLASKQSAPDFLALRQRMQGIASQFADGETPVIFFSDMRLREQERLLEVSGEVRNIGQRSMTVLAQFVEAVQELPLVADVQNPRFTRSFSDEKGDFSPFTILITLR